MLVRSIKAELRMMTANDLLVPGQLDFEEILGPIKDIPLEGTKFG